MYDSVQLWLSTPNGQSVLPYLSERKETTALDENGRVSLSGNLGNIRVRVCRGGVSINGSLPKFHLKTNAGTLDRSETGRAIQNLSDELHLPLESACVTRFELGENFILSRPVGGYLVQLGESSRYERMETQKDETLTYANKQRILQFYDKVAELKNSRAIVPESFLNKSVLRYEARFQQTPKRQFSRRSLVASDLYERQFFREAVNRWMQEYFSIRKIGKNIPADLGSIKGVQSWLMREGIEANGGQATVLSMLEAEKGRSLPERSFYRIRDNVMKVSALNSAEVTEGSICELDEQIKRAAEDHLC